MEVFKIAKTVRNVLTEMTQMVVAMYQLNENFCQAYADKELSRFSNPLLCDPITRVARDPLRKLAISDRLIGAAMLCIQCGVLPKWLLIGIKAALSYDNEKDPDHHVMKLVKDLDPETFIQGVLHVRPEEKLYPLLMEVMRG
jgi:mannitol-1-phosphate 5-dehydrogenase